MNLLKPYKKDFDHSYTFGVFPTLELIEHKPGAALKVLASESGLKNRGVTKLEELCERHSIPFEVNTKQVERLAPKENSYAIGIFHKYTAALDPAGDHLLLVNPSDMGNLGTIIRTMLGFNVTNLGIIRPAADIFDPRAIRASMGALFALSFQYFDTYEAYSASYAAPNRALYPFITNANQALPATRFTHPNTLIFGNESSGLPDTYRAIGQTITIPHTSRIDSLNLTIAVGIALYAVHNPTQSPPS